VKSSEVIDCLRRFRFAGPSWAVVTELKPSTGYAGENRRIDLFAIECAPSKGMPKHAVEVKVSRADWLRELKQPLKRRMAMAISNYFWIAAPAGVVKPEELPPMCGLLEVPDDWQTATRYGWGWLERHPAEYRDAVRPTWSLVASLLRRPQLAATQPDPTP
jgi:hypothetical protein